MKKSKMNYYNHYFKTNWDSTKNTWKGLSIIYLNIIYILSINNNATNIPKILVSDDTASTEPIQTANTIKKLFTSIAAKTKESLNYSHKHFSHFPRNRSDVLFPRSH